MRQIVRQYFVHFYIYIYIPTHFSHSTAVDSIVVRAQRSDYELFCLITNENIRPIQRTEITTEGTLILKFATFSTHTIPPFLPARLAPASAPVENCREHFGFNCVS